MSDLVEVVYIFFGLFGLMTMWVNVLLFGSLESF